jgi:hypothetical protein
LLFRQHFFWIPNRVHKLYHLRSIHFLKPAYMDLLLASLLEQVPVQGLVQVPVQELQLALRVPVLLQALIQVPSPEIKHLKYNPVPVRSVAVLEVPP